MSLKAVLFDFNGVIINDEPLHERLIEQLMIQENLRLQRGEFRQACLGRSDRACIVELFNRKGRVLSEAYLSHLLLRKAEAYKAEIERVEKLPIFMGLLDLIGKLREAKLVMAVVTGALRSEVELVLSRTQLTEHFDAIAAGDEIQASKPEPDGYLLAIERLNQRYPSLNLLPSECLAIEDTFAGIAAAQRAGIPVVGVAHTYPFHMLQRVANWTIDYLTDLELDRVQQVYGQGVGQSAVG